MPLRMVVSHVLDYNYIIASLRFIYGLVHTVLGQRPRMFPDSSTLMSLFEGPQQVHVPCDFWVSIWVCSTILNTPNI